MTTQFLHLVLPLPPSLNSCFRNIAINRRVPTKKAIMWTREAKTILRQEVKMQGWELSKEKTVVEITVFWKDARKSDCCNREKILSDSMNGIVFEDEHLCLPRFMDYSIDRKNPRVELLIYRK